MRDGYLFDFAAICNMTPREVDEMWCRDFFGFILHIDDVKKRQQQQQQQ